MSLGSPRFLFRFSLSVDCKELTNARDGTFHIIKRRARLRIWSRAELSNQTFLREDLQRGGKVAGWPDEAPIDQLVIDLGKSSGLPEHAVPLRLKPASKNSFHTKRGMCPCGPGKNVHWLVRHAGFDNL